MGASAAYRQVASVGGSAVQHSRKNKWGAAACVSESKRVRRAQAAALHGEHPAKSASGKSPSTKGFPHGPVLRGRQSKDILFSMDHHRAADCKGGVRAGCVPGACRVCVPGACRVRAGCCAGKARPPSETRRRVCHVSSGDQHRSSKKDSSIGEAAAGLWAGTVCGSCVRCCGAV